MEVVDGKGAGRARSKRARQKGFAGDCWTCDRQGHRAAECGKQRRAAAAAVFDEDGYEVVGGGRRRGNGGAVSATGPGPRLSGGQGARRLPPWVLRQLAEW